MPGVSTRTHTKKAPLKKRTKFFPWSAAGLLKWNPSSIQNGMKAMYWVPIKMELTRLVSNFKDVRNVDTHLSAFRTNGNESWSPSEKWTYWYLLLTYKNLAHRWQHLRSIINKLNMVINILENGGSLYNNRLQELITLCHLWSMWIYYKIDDLMPKFS